MFLTIIAFILTIGLLVVIHELGHYLTAKKFGIKVLEFGFGLPPRAWGKKIGETIWSINWLPFGGFVHLLGEDESKKENLENERSFAAQNVWKRIAVVVAGVTMNLFLAFILYTGVLAAQGWTAQVPLLTDHQFVGVSQNNEMVILVQSVSPDSPAALAGLTTGDRVVAFNDVFLLNSQDLVNKTAENLDQPIKLTVTDIKRTTYRQVDLTPRSNPPEGEGAIGVNLGSFELANLSYNQLWQKVLAGPIHSYNLAAYSGEILGSTIGTAWQRQDIAPVRQNVAGPLGITQIVGEILKVENPVIPYLDFVAALSLNLALVNILPFPGLDGGRFFFLSIEAMTGKRPKPVVEKYIHTVGLVMLLGLIFLITASDIQKIFF